MAQVLKWRSDFDKYVVTANFERRGWEKWTSGEDDWNVFWANVHTVKQIFNPENGIRLGDHQMVNQVDPIALLQVTTENEVAHRTMMPRSQAQQNCRSQTG